MGRSDSKKPAPAATLRRQLVLLIGFAQSAMWVGCTHHVQIEPSDKPFVVNLNVKIDHDIRVKVEDQNKDLLNLENEVLQNPKAAKKKGGKQG